MTLLMAVSIVLGFSACSDNENENYQGINYVYLSAANEATIAENATDPLSVQVTLTSPLSTDVTLVFKLDNNEVVELVNTELTIAKGKIKGQLNLRSKGAGKLMKATDVSITMEALSAQNIALRAPLRIHVTPRPNIPELTDAQQQLIQTYREKYNLNILSVLGELNVETKIKYKGESYLAPLVNPETKTIQGKTVITLSEKADAEHIVLKMVNNPMGMTAYLYRLFRYETVENNEYWYGEYAAPYYKVMMDAIGLTKTSEETFTMELDNIVVDPQDGHALSFVGKGKDGYGDEIDAVPFVYHYSANERWLAKIAEGATYEVKNGTTTERVTAKELRTSGANLDPNSYLFTTSISSDNWENDPSD